MKAEGILYLDQSLSTNQRRQPLVFCFTFAPGVEQQEDVVGRVVFGDAHAVAAVGFHREPIPADGGRGRRVHRQHYLFVHLFDHGGLPAVVSQLLHQRDDHMGSLRHGGQLP